ncbi:Ribonuclease H2 subunit B [Pseudozyma hubeiensis]|nr:Ribonuclease H2 subunit B [Pseudozyma hubeiensis]
MAAATDTASASASTSGPATRSMRTGVLINPTTATSGRLLILPHPQTLIPTYYLASPSSGELYELSTLQDSKHDRTWMISQLNQVVSSGQLDILSRVDARFLVVSLLHSVLDDGKYRSREDLFEQAAQKLYSRRKEELRSAIPELKKGGDEDDVEQQEWLDVVTFGNLDLVKTALEDVADVQDLPTGEKAYRLSLSKTFHLLDRKHTLLSQRSTFAQTPNTLGRTFERSWPHESDPSPYLSLTENDEGQDCKDAAKLRSQIAAEVIATYLPAKLAAEYFAHLGVE